MGGLCLILPGLVRPEFHDFAGELIGLVVVTAVLRRTVLGLCLQDLVAFPVVVEGLDKFLESAFFLVVDEVLDREETVDRGGEGDTFHGDEADLGAALCDVQSLFGTAADEAGQVRGRVVLRTDGLGEFIVVDEFLDEVFRLFLVGGEELLPGVEFFDLTGPGTVLGEFRGLAAHDVFIGLHVLAVVVDQLEGLQQVDVVVNGAGPVVADHGVLEAADGSVFADVVFVDQIAIVFRFAHHTGHGAFIEVQEERSALGLRDHVDHFVEEFLGRALVQTDIGLRLEDGAPVVDDVEEQVGQVVRHVLTAFAHAGEGQQLTETCGDALVAADFDHGVIGGVGMEPHAAEDVLHEVFGHAVFDGLFVVRIEVLVDAAEGNTGTRIILIGHDQHVGHPKGLDGFPEVCGAVPRDFRRVLSHLQEFFLADRVLDLVRALLAVRGELRGQFLRDGAGRHHGSELRTLLTVFLSFGEVVVHRLIALVFRLEALVDDLLVVRDEVAGRGTGVAVAVFEQERHALTRFFDQFIAVLLFRFGQTHRRHDIEAAAAEEVTGDDLHGHLVHDDFFEEVRLPLDEALLPEPVRHRNFLRELFERAGERRQERVVLRDDVVRHLVELTVPGSPGRVTGVLVVPFAIHAFKVVISEPFGPRAQVTRLFDRILVLNCQFHYLLAILFE